MRMFIVLFSVLFVASSFSLTGRASEGPSNLDLQDQNRESPAQHVSASDGHSLPEEKKSVTFTYSAVSIKESQTGASFSFQILDPPDSGRLDILNFSFLDMVTVAFNVNYGQILGAPDWARERRYVIQARAEEEVNTALAALPPAQAREEKRRMLQAILAERFGLKVSWKESLGLVYALKVSRGHAKLSIGGSTALTQEEASWEKMPSLYQKGDGMRGYQFIGHKCSINDLAKMLTSQMSAPVHDETGLTESYDFVIKYRGVAIEDSPREDAWPPLPSALKDQLGLELVPQKGLITYLSIDKVGELTPN